MKIKKRDPITAIILSIVTCGIYMIFWAIDLAKGACSVKDENDPATIEMILCIFLPFIGLYMAEQKFAAGCAAKGIPHTDNTILYLVLGFVFCPAAFFMMQTELNKIA